MATTAPANGLLLALGSNLGDRLKTLHQAREGLESRFGLCVSSAVYETEPVGCPAGSLAFLNAVIWFPYAAAEPQGVLAVTQDKETLLGRVRTGEQNAPRTIDIDILSCGQHLVAEAHLTLPHPRLHQRRFVLQPLAEICGQAVLPGMTQSVADLLANLVSSEPPLLVYSRDWKTKEPAFRYHYARPSATVDVLLFCAEELLLIRRAHAPFAGCWALPGGFVDCMEDLPVAAARELLEETGLELTEMTQLATYGRPGRDPRGHTISIAYAAVTDQKPQAQAADDAAEARWFSIHDLPALAFDHAKVVADGIAWLKRQ
jgi:2-amino-4-hydroxy-6-hydroxymethyldihydropteridine diphosphokinase